MDVNILSWNSLNGTLGPIKEKAVDVDSHIFLCHIKVREVGEHQLIVILLLRVFIFQSHNFEALPTVMASMNWTLPYKVKHLLMRMRIVFNSWTHTNDYSP
jgi:hypothetical protein